MKKNNKTAKSGRAEEIVSKDEELPAAFEQDFQLARSNLVSGREGGRSC